MPLRLPGYLASRLRVRDVVNELAGTGFDKLRMSDDKPTVTPEQQDSDEKRRPKATLIKRKPEPPAAVEPAVHQDRDRHESGGADGARPETERRRIVVVKKSRRTVVLKRKPSTAAGSESHARGPEHEPRPVAAEPHPAPAPQPRVAPRPAPAGGAPLQSPAAPRPTPKASTPTAAVTPPVVRDSGTTAAPPARANRPSAEPPARGVDPQRRPEDPGRQAPAAPRRASAQPPGQLYDRSAGAKQPRDAAAGKFGPGRRLTSSADRIRAAEEPLRPISRARDSDQPLPEIRDRFRRRPAARTPGRGRMPPPRTGGFRAPGERSPGGGRRIQRAAREVPQHRCAAVLPLDAVAADSVRSVAAVRAAVVRGRARRHRHPLSDGRTGGKKFFRTKRRSSIGYHIGPEEHEEKVSLTRKKPVPVANPVPKGN